MFSGALLCSRERCPRRPLKSHICPGFLGVSVWACLLLSSFTVNLDLSGAAGCGSEHLKTVVGVPGPVSASCKGRVLTWESSFWCLTDRISIGPCVQSTADTVSVTVIITTSDQTVCDLWVLGPVLATKGHKRNSTRLFLQAGLPPPVSCEVLNCGDGRASNLQQNFPGSGLPSS